MDNSKNGLASERYLLFDTCSISGSITGINRSPRLVGLRPLLILPARFERIKDPEGESIGGELIIIAAQGYSAVPRDAYL